MDRKTAHFVKHYFLVAGGIGLGVYAVFGINILREVFAGFPLFEKLVYLFIAAAAILDLMTHKANCAICSRRKK